MENHYLQIILLMNFNIGDTPVMINSEDGFGVSATTFNTPVVVEGFTGNALSFNGTTQYLKTNTITNAKAISLWIKLDSSQIIGWNYLIDAREGLSFGYFADTTIGSSWEKMYVNGVEKTRTWDNIPQDVWTHLYIISNTSFTDDINFMSRYTGNETKLGLIDNIKIYSEALN